MASTQLNCRIEQVLAERLRQAALDRHCTPGVLVAQAIEQLLAVDSTPLAAVLAELEQRVAALEGSRVGLVRAKTASPDRVIPAPHTGESPLLGAGDGITTAELAERTGTNRAAWNNWAAKASAGDVRHHPDAGSWKLIGKVPPVSGGPARWLWKPLGGS